MGIAELTVGPLPFSPDALELLCGLRLQLSALLNAPLRRVVTDRLVDASNFSNNLRPK